MNGWRLALLQASSPKIWAHQSKQGKNVGCFDLIFFPLFIVLNICMPKCFFLLLRFNYVILQHGCHHDLVFITMQWTHLNANAPLCHVSIGLAQVKCTIGLPKAILWVTKIELVSIVINLVAIKESLVTND